MQGVAVGVKLPQEGPPTGNVNPASEPPPVFTKAVEPLAELTLSDQNVMVTVSGRSESWSSSTLTVPSGVPFGSISMSPEGIGPLAPVAETVLMEDEFQQP